MARKGHAASKKKDTYNIETAEIEKKGKKQQEGNHK